MDTDLRQKLQVPGDKTDICSWVLDRQLHFCTQTQTIVEVKLWTIRLGLISICFTLVIISQPALTRSTINPHLQNSAHSFPQQHNVMPCIANLQSQQSGSKHLLLRFPENFWPKSREFLTDCTNSRTIGTVLRPSVCRLSVCMECIVAKRCVLEQKLLLRAYRKSYMRNRLVTKWMTLTFI